MYRIKLLLCIFVSTEIKSFTKVSLLNVFETKKVCPRAHGIKESVKCLHLVQSSRQQARVLLVLLYCGHRRHSLLLFSLMMQAAVPLNLGAVNMWSWLLASWHLMENVVQRLYHLCNYLDYRRTGNLAATFTVTFCVKQATKNT